MTDDELARLALIRDAMRPDWTRLSHADTVWTEAGETDAHETINQAWVRLFGTPVPSAFVRVGLYDDGDAVYSLTLDNSVFVVPYDGASEIRRIKKEGDPVTTHTMTIDQLNQRLALGELTVDGDLVITGGTNITDIRGFPLRVTGTLTFARTPAAAVESPASMFVPGAAVRVIAGLYTGRTGVVRPYTPSEVTALCLAGITTLTGEPDQVRVMIDATAGQPLAEGGRGGLGSFSGWFDVCDLQRV